MGDVKAKTIVIASGVWPRRKMRRMRGPLMTPAGPVELDESVPLSVEWTPVSISGVSMRARRTFPPVILLAKPVDCVTSRRPDGGSQTVFQLLEYCEFVDELSPIGRLDRDTTGVLLFTLDGQLLHRLTHPKRGIERRYEATLSAPLPDGAAEQLMLGEVELRDGHNPRPIALTCPEPLFARVTLTEGKYHEVRRMFAAVGSDVVALDRTHYAGVTADGLEEGEWRRLDEPEVLALYESVGLTPTADFLQVELVHG